MIRSASAARWCIAVRKQRLNSGHFEPEHASRRASRRCHRSESSGRKLSSARSPVSVTFSQSRIWWNQSSSSRPLSDGLVAHAVDFFAAQEIAAPLHHGHFQFGREIFLQKRNVLLEKLLLQRFRRRRNHHAPPAANRGNQIRQRFARAGPGLDNQVPLFLERGLHQLRHLELRRPVLVALRHAFFERAARPENFGNRGLLQIRLIRMGVRPFRQRRSCGHGLRIFFGAFGHWRAGASDSSRKTANR